jgi:hypothetical protein
MVLGNVINHFILFSLQIATRNALAPPNQVVGMFYTQGYPHHMLIAPRSYGLHQTSSRFFASVPTIGGVPG